MGRHMHVPRDRQWQLVGRPSQEFDFPIDLGPLIRMLREPEDEFIVHKVRARAPTLAEETCGANGETRVLTFDLSPIRFHGSTAPIGLTLAHSRHLLRVTSLRLKQVFQAARAASS